MNTAAHSSRLPAVRASLWSGCCTGNSVRAYVRACDFIAVVAEADAAAAAVAEAAVRLLQQQQQQQVQDSVRPNARK